MAIYEYECRDCGERFSALISISKRDEAEKTLTCPACGARDPIRLISNFASAVKGASTPSAPPGCGGGG